MIRLFNTTSGAVVEVDGRFASAPQDWDDFFIVDSVERAVRTGFSQWPLATMPVPGELLPPVRSQEVWAAGVTYLRSKAARMAEAEEAGGGDFYDRVYDADRPELFLKATPHRVSGHGQPIRIRSDSTWNVPEPELAVAVNRAGQVFGYTIGNDMSSRDIEGENPLYLPQAKVYDQSCAVGPSILIADAPLPDDTAIQIAIERDGNEVFGGETTLAMMKRKPQDLVDWLFRDSSFPNGCILLTGTGVVPPDSFTLEAGDAVRITIEPIGVLENVVVQRASP
jgi:2-dehydro-3-deoxy-D-arabinonate dehydratase